jgi:hypothetical protein
MADESSGIVKWRRKTKDTGVFLFESEEVLGQFPIQIEVLRPVQKKKTIVGTVLWVRRVMLFPHPLHFLFRNASSQGIMDQ